MRDKRLEKAQLKVFWEAPFFAAGVSKLPVVWDDSVPTACTDGRQIRWNPKHFDGLKDQEVVTVLAHETAHCLLGHLWRAPAGADADLWNQACDHAVNDMLADFGAMVKAKGFADPFPMPANVLVGNPAFKDMAEEAIYNRLVKAPQSPQDKPGANKGGGSGQTPASGQGQGQGTPSPGQGRKPFGEFELPKDGADPSSQKKLVNEWDETLLSSAKFAGDVPGSVKRLIGEMVHPSVPWWGILRNWLREQCADDWDWTKPNQLFDESGFILPTLDSERMAGVVFATDTSGSIDSALLARFHAEKQNCLDELNPASLRDLCCDTQITKDCEYRSGDKIDPEAPGRGGTDFKPVFERVSQGQVPKCLVYLTDLEGRFPEADPGYPVLWVVWGGQTKAPFGQVVSV